MASRIQHTIQSTLVLNAQEADRLTVVLQEHLEDAEAIYAAIIDESGTTLAEAQSQPLAHKMEICTLANSALGAVQEISRRLDDAADSVFFHQGNRMTFALAQASPTASLLTVCGPQARLGLIRGALALTMPKLIEALSTVATLSEPLHFEMGIEPFDPSAFFAFADTAEVAVDGPAGPVCE